MSMSPVIFLQKPEPCPHPAVAVDNNPHYYYSYPITIKNAFFLRPNKSMEGLLHVKLGVEYYTTWFKFWMIEISKLNFHRPVSGLELETFTHFLLPVSEDLRLLTCARLI